MNELTLYWENVGIYEVKRYFKALASAMQNLPDFIQKQNGAISTTGTTYTIRIGQDELNTFYVHRMKYLKILHSHLIKIKLQPPVDVISCN